MEGEWTLDTVVDLLERHRQRATYGAVAAVLGRRATFVMSGYPRKSRYSWVVNKETGLPTGYTPEQMHPDLRVRSSVLETGEELEGWLRFREERPEQEYPVRDAFLPAQADDFRIEIAGRESPGLSRLVGVIGALVLGMRDRLRQRHGR